MWRAYHTASARAMRDVARWWYGAGYVCTCARVRCVRLLCAPRLVASFSLPSRLSPPLVGVGWWRHRRRHPLISQATPPFFIFSLLKRQMDKVYCKVGSALGKTVRDGRGETSAPVREREEARRDTDGGRNRKRASERGEELRCR